jgi:hypothetical protein
LNFWVFRVQVGFASGCRDEIGFPLGLAEK